MVVVMQERASEAQIEQVVKRLVEMGMDVHRSTGVTRTVLGAVGQGHPDAGLIEMLDGVHEVLRISSPYKLASRTFKQEPTVITVGDVRIGGDEVIVMAGPCSAESSHSSIVAEMPRFSSTGLRTWPSSRSSVKFCMLRAPTW